MSSRTRCDVGALLRQLTSSDDGEVNVSKPPGSKLKVDQSVLSFTIEEALSNARKHRVTAERLPEERRAVRHCALLAARRISPHQVSHLKAEFRAT